MPNPKVRPLVDLPWSADFTVRLYDNPELSPAKMFETFEQGGLKVGFGTYRGMYGKFAVTRWDVTEGE